MSEGDSKFSLVVLIVILAVGIPFVLVKRANYEKQFEVTPAERASALARDRGLAEARAKIDSIVEAHLADAGELASEAAEPGAGIGTGAWVQAELTEKYMRELTKDQCMLKTINSLQTCGTKDCIDAMAGVVGNCVTWGKGDLLQFCEEYRERYIVSCLSGELSRAACAVVYPSESVLCESG